MAEYFELGFLALFAASFIAATILPFSSEALLLGILMAGYNPTACLIIATAGNWLGGLTNYYLGYLGKWEALEKWFNTKKEKVLNYKNVANKYGSLLALLSWVPIIGDLLAIALGFFRVKAIPVFLFMLVGKAARYAVIVFLYNQ